MRNKNVAYTAETTTESGVFLKIQENLLNE